MTEIYHVSEGIDKPIPVLTGPIAMDDPITFEEGSHVIVKGNVTVGSALAPITDDEILLHVRREATLIIDGNLELYRDVDAANPLVLVDSLGKLIVTGDVKLSREGIGAGGVLLVSVFSKLKVIGETDLIAFEGVPTSAGSFLLAERGSKVYFGQVLFNGGADFDMGAFPTVLMDTGSQLHVSDVPGASDALNTNNPGAPACTGIQLLGGAQAHLPPWQANTGIGAAGAPANGRDVKVGAAAVADWNGSEVLVDANELCLANKP